MSSWFLSPNGRLFTRSVVGIAAASVFSFQLALHGPLLNQYRELMQMYRNGLPKRLSSAILQTADLVLNECGLDESKKEKVQFFTVIGQNLFHAGNISSPWGAVIGLPFMFGIESSNRVDMMNMKIYGRKNIDWFGEGKDLLDSLILSQDAQKFAIAREIFACDMKPVFVNALLSTVAILVPAKIVHKANASGKTLRISFKKRALFYLVIYAIGFLMYKCFKDPNKYILEKKCDRQAACLGPGYLEGGIEFYEKTLRKNKALRSLMGPGGQRSFDLNGNESYLFFAPQLPTSKRLELLQQLKKEQDVAVDS